MENEFCKVVGTLEGEEGREEEEKGKEEGRGGEGRERAGSAPKLKLAPRTIFQAPALSENLTAAYKMFKQT